MFLVVGLGNPGEEYAKTRHNIGFMAADKIFSRYKFQPYKNKFEGLIAEGNIDGEKVLLLKPQTFMNLSGNAVNKVASFYKIEPQNIIVIHDDKDLALGKIKAKTGGSAGGHNGIKNIDSQIGPEYNRIRIGAGSPKEHNTDTISFVLSRFSKAEMEVLEERLDFVAETINELIKKGIAHYSNVVGMHNTK
ncbi:MAG: aminoacyl-tRNA hydrolase [Alphaproteobacteria bacterium]|nr:aminoacyl-tRNA hydrolase [Alphaproteobacteria bacterium]